MTSDVMADWIWSVTGCCWYRRADDSLHTTEVFAPPEDGDVFLLEVSEAWLSQFGDQQELANYLEPMMPRLNEIEGFDVG